MGLVQDMEVNLTRNRCLRRIRLPMDSQRHCQHNLMDILTINSGLKISSNNNHILFHFNVVTHTLNNPTMGMALLLITRQDHSMQAQYLLMDHSKIPGSILPTTLVNSIRVHSLFRTQAHRRVFRNHLMKLPKHKPL